MFLGYLVEGEDKDEGVCGCSWSVYVMMRLGKEVRMGCGSPASVKGATEVELGPDRGPRVIAPREVEPLQVAAVVLDRTQACVMELFLLGLVVSKEEIYKTSI